MQNNGPIHGKGMVMQVLDKSFDVVMKDFGITQRVYCEVDLVGFIIQSYSLLS